MRHRSGRWACRCGGWAPTTRGSSGRSPSSAPCAAGRGRGPEPALLHEPLCHPGRESARARELGAIRCDANTEVQLSGPVLGRCGLRFPGGSPPTPRRRSRTRCPGRPCLPLPPAAQRRRYAAVPPGRHAARQPRASPGRCPAGPRNGWTASCKPWRPCARSMPRWRARSSATARCGRSWSNWPGSWASATPSALPAPSPTWRAISTTPTCWCSPPTGRERPTPSWRRWPRGSR